MIKKTIITLAITGLLIGASSASAATTTPSVDQLIAQLQAQIVALNAQLVTLRAAQTNVSTSKQDLNETLKLIAGLKEGMSGEQVTLLQTVLAADPAIYPEANVSGYYGKLTTQAIKRFQKKYHIEANGRMGDATLAKLNKELNERKLSREDRDEKKGAFCIPPGHAIASGWLKKEREKDNRGKGNGTIQWTKEGMLIPFCNAKSTTTPATPDTTAPTILLLATSNVSANSVTITWSTNESAASAVYLSSTTPVATSSATWTNGAFTTTHTATVSGLLPNTVYSYIVSAKDATGNTTMSAQGTFTTTAAPDITAPVITNMVATPTSSTTATVTWTTNEAASSKVYFGTVSPLVLSTATSISDVSMVTAHSLSIAGLSASTTYKAVVESRDAANNVATGTEITWVSL